MDFKRHILSVESKREWNDRSPHKDYHYSSEEEDFNYATTGNKSRINKTIDCN